MGKSDWQKGFGFIKNLMGSGTMEVPYLAELNFIRKQEYSQYTTRLGVVGSICGSVGAALGVALGILFASNRIQLPAGALVGTIIGLNALTWGAFGWFALGEKRRRDAKLARFPLRKQANEVLEKIGESVSGRRLHREMVPSAAELMNEAARHYMRLHKLLNDPFWTSDKLAEHWQTSRQQALAAADQAMDEVLVLLSDAYRADTSPGWQRVLEDIMSGYSIPDRAENNDLPRGFFAAEDITQKLRALAAEMERLSNRMQLESQTQVYGANALDIALSEVRSLQVAETELRQQIGQPPNP